MNRIAALDWSLDQVEYPDATTAIVPVEAHYDNGVTAYRVMLDRDTTNRCWLAHSIDPHPPTDALSALLGEEAVERLTAREEREYAEAAWDAEVML